MHYNEPINLKKRQYFYFPYKNIGAKARFIPILHPLTEVRGNGYYILILPWLETREGFNSSLELFIFPGLQKNGGIKYRKIAEINEYSSDFKWLILSENYSQTASKISSISPGVLIIFMKVPILNSGQLTANRYFPGSIVAFFPCKIIS